MGGIGGLAVLVSVKMVKGFIFLEIPVHVLTIVAIGINLLQFD